MAGAIVAFAVVLCVSFLEGSWAWLLAAAASEVADQVYPSAPAVGLILFGAWLAARILAIANVPLVRRRWALAGGGLGLALAVGTVQSGLLHPLQLVFGQYTPDYRGAGLVMVLLVAYLWGRGLWLAGRVTRERLLNHITLSASALVLVLVFLPLTDAVRGLGLGVVIASFLLAVTALLLHELAQVEWRQLTPLQWASVAALNLLLLVIAGWALTGVFTSPALGLLGQLTRGLARATAPVTDMILLGAGYMAHYLAMLFRWLGETFGGDPEIIVRNFQRAEQERPRFEEDPSQGPPEILATMVAVFLTLMFVSAVVAIYVRLVRNRRAAGDEEIYEVRMPAGHGGLGSAIRAAFGRLSELRGREGAARDAREAIRRHYRTFQALMARADIPRAHSQTPWEYQAQVSGVLPAAAPAVSHITDAYILARYAPPDVDLPDPRSVGTAVGDVRTALRSHE